MVGIAPAVYGYSDRYPLDDFNVVPCSVLRRQRENAEPVPGQYTLDAPPESAVRTAVEAEFRLLPSPYVGKLALFVVCRHPGVVERDERNERLDVSCASLSCIRAIFTRVW